MRERTERNYIPMAALIIGDRMIREIEHLALHGRDIAAGRDLLLETAQFDEDSETDRRKTSDGEIE